MSDNLFAALFLVASCGITCAVLLAGLGIVKLIDWWEH